MKKSLIFAMAMALGVTASAYAANPFSDVPAGHWAYDSIEKLAAAGVIDGYGDGTFGGDKLMTRYEMAQIVARAMANGANVDKLAAEFADELDALGVRVANLEKKADAVKITGQIRTSYNSFHGNTNASTSILRSRLWFKGQINDDWSYTGMIENQQNLRNYVGDESTSFQRAFVNGKLGGAAIEAGRNHVVLVDATVFGDRVDYVKASYGKDIKLTGMVGKMADTGDLYTWADGTAAADKTPANANGYGINGQEFWAASVGAKIGVVNADVTYVDIKNQKQLWTADHADEDNSIWAINVKFPIIKKLTLQGAYLKADKKDNGGRGDDDGIFAILK